MSSEKKRGKDSTLPKADAPASMPETERPAPETECPADHADNEPLAEEENGALPTPKFTVDTVLDAAVQQEASVGTRSASANVLFFTCLGILVIMLGVLAWQYFALKTANLFYIALVIIAIGYAAYIRLLGPKVALRRWENEIVQRYQTSALHLSSEFYDLAMTQMLRETDTSVEAGYSELRRMKETANLFLLQSGDRQWFFVAKDGFTKGSADEFRAFMREKLGGN